MNRELYIVKCAIEEVSGKCNPEVMSELRLYEVRIDNAISKARKFGDTPEIKAERLEAFHNFQKTFERAQLLRYVSGSS